MRNRFLKESFGKSPRPILSAMFVSPVSLLSSPERALSNAAKFSGMQIKVAVFQPDLEA